MEKLDGPKNKVGGRHGIEEGERRAEECVERTYLFEQIRKR